jgi:hypothetical protein
VNKTLPYVVHQTTVHFKKTKIGDLTIDGYIVRDVLVESLTPNGEYVVWRGTTIWNLYQFEVVAQTDKHLDDPSTFWVVNRNTS